MTPTARTLNHLRRLGYQADVVERFIAQANIHKDLLAFVCRTRCRLIGNLGFFNWNGISLRKPLFIACSANSVLNKQDSRFYTTSHLQDDTETLEAGRKTE